MAQQPSFGITPQQEASQLQFYRRQLWVTPPPAGSRKSINLRGKTAIVTGANGGIGLECSRQLLGLGLSKLILAVRDERKGEIARTTLKNTSALDPAQTIEVWKLDYASYDSITAFAQRVEALNPRLDIAILNAGVQRGAFCLNSATGHEEIMQTNYLSTALLVLALLRVFKNAGKNGASSRSGPGRIVVVSSDMAAWAKFEERHEEPMLKAFDRNSPKWDTYDRYGTSKLMCQLFVAELAKRIPPSLAIVNCANPGLCHGSTLAHELGMVTAIFIRLFGRTASVGARTIVHAVTEQDEKSHGQYVEDAELRPMAPLVYSEEAEGLMSRLWHETVEELSFANVQEIVEL